MTADLELALRRFDLGDPIESPVAVAEAWSNEVYRVRTRRGAFAVKLFPPNLSSSRLQVLLRAIFFEQWVLADGIAAPVPVLTRDGEVLAELPVRAGVRMARCHEWVFGTPASQVVGTDGIAASAGQVLGRLHALQVPGGDTSQLQGPDQDRWARAVAASRAAGQPWVDELVAITPLVRRLADQIDDLRRQRRPMQLSHRDFDPKNAVLDADGRLIITDWDFAGPVVAGVELVTAAASFTRTEQQLREFAAAYRGAGAPPNRPTSRLSASKWPSSTGSCATSRPLSTTGSGRNRSGTGRPRS
ncbi:Ser/Thr protein kinase RdoA (MazF antagonist) [Microlunatus parietis]|uniref:Ser/Thr protein kinase RdoA (MazF antagonist) n=1 Tax=Microlunatus parietis TaxID=682979 RepID=A0A7Y9I7S5_9ACTN|nr:Ser/Thr protein kinase RdoA (MazF antagonist) [Microlunatus parietis]